MQNCRIKCVIILQKKFRKIQMILRTLTYPLKDIYNLSEVNIFSCRVCDIKLFIDKAAAVVIVLVPRVNYTPEVNLGYSGA